MTIRLKKGLTGAVETKRMVTDDLPSVAATKVSVIRGLELITVTGSVQQERTLRADRGALVYRITDEVSRATGLREGDVILQVNQTPIRTASQMASLLESMGSNRRFRIFFERGGSPSYVDLSFR